MLDDGLVWTEYWLPDDVRILAKRCTSRQKFAQTIIAAITRGEKKVALYLHQGDPVHDVLNYVPTCMLADEEITLSRLAHFLHRHDIERIISEVNAQPFYDLFPSSLYVHALVEYWLKIRLPGWVYTTISMRGFALSKDFDSFSDGHSHAVRVTDTGVIVYRATIQGGGATFQSEVMFRMAKENFAERWLANICCWDHAIEICGVQRALCRWVFNAAVENND